jgi:cell division septation protein DedD
MAELPGWTPFDPEAPPTLPEVEDGPGRIVGIVATYLSTTLGWAGPVAADLASSWSARGHRVVLTDGGLVEPQLHDVFGVANAEGVTDAALFGASVRRIARPVRGGTYFLVCAGTAVADPEGVLRSPRWTRLCESFRKAGVTLVVFVSPDEPSYSWVMGVASDVVVLAGPHEDVNSLVNGAADVVRGVIGVDAGLLDESAAGAVDAQAWPEIEALEPPPRAPARPPREAASAQTGAARPHHGPGEDLPAWTREARRQGEQGVEGAAPRAHGAAASLPGQPTEELPSWAEVAKQLATERGAGTDAAEARPGAVSAPAPRRARREAGRGKRPGALLLALLAILLGLVAAASFGLVEIPGISPLSMDVQLLEQDLEVVAHSIPQPETTTPVSYSVALGAFQDPGVAMAQAEQLVRGTGTFVTTAPVVVNGTVFHRLLAGPARDSAEAIALLARLRAAGGVAEQDLAVRATPLAFRLGETGALEEARRRADELKSLEIPAYVLAVEYADGAVRHRIYAGAYANEAEAEYLTARLAERGLGGALLSQRTGRVPE